MKFKRFSVLIVIMLILSIFTGSSVFAKTERTPKPMINIVALGILLLLAIHLLPQQDSLI